MEAKLQARLDQFLLAHPDSTLSYPQVKDMIRVLVSITQPGHSVSSKAIDVLEYIPTYEEKGFLIDATNERLEFENAEDELERLTDRQAELMAQHMKMNEELEEIAERVTYLQHLID